MHLHIMVHQSKQSVNLTSFYMKSSIIDSSENLLYKNSLLLLLPVAASIACCVSVTLILTRVTLGILHQSNLIIMTTLQK